MGISKSAIIAPGSRGDPSTPDKKPFMSVLLVREGNGYVQAGRPYATFSEMNPNILQLIHNVAENCGDVVIFKNK
jgi:hypothetical protein